MHNSNKFALLKEYTDRIGCIYGTEDFAVYLYSIVKMQKPINVIELGTGLGTTMLWLALALQENNQGKLYTVDDGSAWQDLQQAQKLMGSYYRENYDDYVDNLLQTFDLTNVEFYNEHISELNIDNIDLIFSDFAHSVFDITKLLATYLPRMRTDSQTKIMFDSASTYFNSYQALNNIVELLNQNKIPKTLLELTTTESRNKLIELVNSSTFTLEHVIENKNRSQNSTACLTIAPADIFPYPRSNIRF
jgi:predicted O-methyltransferase YrrM